MTYTELLFRLYTASTLITVSIHFILKCGFNNNFFDQFIYLGSKENIYKYVLTHVVAYIVTGFIFGNEKLLWTFLKTTFVEILLVVMKNCNIYKIDNIESAFVSIFIGMISYYIGGTLKEIIFPIKK
jgi:hypothetical protein